MISLGTLLSACATDKEAQHRPLSRAMVLCE